MTPATRTGRSSRSRTIGTVAVRLRPLHRHLRPDRSSPAPVHDPAPCRAAGRHLPRRHGDRADHRRGPSVRRPRLPHPPTVSRRDMGEAVDPGLIDTFLQQFITACFMAVQPLLDASGQFMTAMMWLTVMWAGFCILMGQVGDGSLGKFAGWALKFWVIGYLANNWSEFLFYLAAGMVNLGLSAGPNTMTAADFLMPSQLMKVGWDTAVPIWNHANSLCVGLPSCIMTMGDHIIYEFAVIGILIAFFIMCAQSITAQLKFYFHGLATLALIWAAVDSRTAFIAERAIGGVIANAIKLMVLPLIIAIGRTTFMLLNLPAHHSLWAATLTMFLSFFLAWMCWESSSIASGIINGGPNLSGNSLI